MVDVLKKKLGNLLQEKRESNIQEKQAKLGFIYDSE